MGPNWSARRVLGDSWAGFEMAATPLNLPTYREPQTTVCTAELAASSGPTLREHIVGARSRRKQGVSAPSELGGFAMILSKVPARPESLLAGREEPHEENGEAAVRIDKKHQAGLEVLLAAHDYVVGLQRNVWDLAVEIAELRSVGLHTADMRWLVCKGFVDHGHEKRPLNPDRREFRFDCRLVFRKKSCFVLTEAGVALARRVCNQSPKQDAPPDAHAPSQRSSCKPLVPKWDPSRQQLLLDGKIVKEFKVPAPNQEQVLIAFEEEGWPVHIDDPLPPRPEQDPKQRLHTTVNALNRNQRNHLIRFCGDGRGEGVRWELLAPGENEDESTAAGV